MDKNLNHYRLIVGETRREGSFGEIRTCFERFMSRAERPTYRPTDTRWFSKPYFVAVDIRPIANTYITTLGMHRLSLSDLRMLIEALSRT